jgi:cytochrome c
LALHSSPVFDLNRGLFNNVASLPDLDPDMKKTALTLALLLTTGLFGLQARADGDAQAGEKLFGRLCGGCHQVGSGARAGFGPQLNGVIGRHAGTTEGYQYSEAMKTSGVVWTRETLARYIGDPKSVVAGTRMIFWGVSDQEKIENLLAYLQTFPAP